ncbi:MAG: hypothetical protein ACI8PZ_001910 [Myxococcota bacterium]|jgi:hypothetical protein
MADDSGVVRMGGLELKRGSRIGAYVFMRELGAGGMARVLLAKDPSDKLVALKVLKASRIRQGLLRFRREFRALSKINHPNVVRVEAYGDLHGHPYIAMEYVDGRDLHHLIRSFKAWDHQRRWRRCEEILVDLCRALAAVHRRGLVHRDLKPSNVLITGTGVCKLTDFGIVKDLDPTHDPSQSTTLVGTWAYASPEQCQGHAIDQRSDLYSLGVILFAMLTGKRPFVANDLHGYLELHRDRPAPAPRDVNPSVPEHLDEVCRKLLQKRKSDRYQNAQEILYRLEAEERVPLPSPSDGWEPPLVGRTLEVEALGNAVSRLTAGEGGVVVLEGDDGAGKSRMLDVAIDQARPLGFRFHRDEFRTEAPVFSVLIRTLKKVLTELSDRMPQELLADLQDFTGSQTHLRDARYRLYDSARDALRLALLEGPLLLALDDLHEAQPREIHLLATLVRALAVNEGLPLLVAVTLRHKASQAADAFAEGDDLGLDPQSILVGRLSREDLATLVFGLVGESLGARLLAQRLHKETEGNAYFLSEFVRAMMSKGMISPRGAGWMLNVEHSEIATGHLEIPLGVRQMLRSRLDGVSPDDRNVLQVLAVAGREVDLEVLLDVLDAEEDVVLDALDRLLSAGIVRERKQGDELYHVVVHRTFNDLVYRNLDAERRAWLHRRMAETLELHYAENPLALEIVGEHYRRAGDAGRAYRYLVAAASRLAERSLMHEAWALTQKAGGLESSAAADLDPEHFRKYRRDNLDVRAQVHYNRAEWAEAERTYRVVLQLAEEDASPQDACEARLRLATVLRRRDKQNASRQFAEQALEAARRLHYRVGVADALHCMAALAWGQGNLDECERLATEGLLVAQGSQLADQRAELLLALTAAQATRGHLASATSGLTEAEGIFRELRRKRPQCLALANIAELLTWQGEPLQARQRAHKAVDLAQELDYKLGLVAARRAMAVAALDLGLYEEAERGLASALRTAHDIDLPEEILASHVALCQLHLERGSLGMARRHGEAGLKVVGRRDPERYHPLLLAHLARAVATSDPAEAASLAGQADAILAETPIPRRTQVALALAYAWTGINDLDRARTTGRRVLQLAGSRGFRLIGLEARAVMAHLTTGEERDTHQTVGRELARDFTAVLTADMVKAFHRRPFLRFLE